MKTDLDTKAERVLKLMDAIRKLTKNGRITGPEEAAFDEGTKLIGVPVVRTLEAVYGMLHNQGSLGLAEEHEQLREALETLIAELEKEFA